MGNEHKPGFIYVRSDDLKQEVAFSIKTGWLYCEDKTGFAPYENVRYSPAELAVLEKAGAQIDILTHRVKKIIGGEIVEIRQAAPPEAAAPVKQGEFEIW